MDRGAWWAAIHGVTKSRTPRKCLSRHGLFPDAESVHCICIPSQNTLYSDIYIYIYIILQVSHRCVGPRVEIYIRSCPAFFFFFTSFTVRKCLVSLGKTVT